MWSVARLCVCVDLSSTQYLSSTHKPSHEQLAWLQFLCFKQSLAQRVRKSKKMTRSKTAHRGVSMSSFVTFFGDLLLRPFWRGKWAVLEASFSGSIECKFLDELFHAYSDCAVLASTSKSIDWTSLDVAQPWSCALQRINNADWHAMGVGHWATVSECAAIRSCCQRALTITPESCINKH